MKPVLFNTQTVRAVLNGSRSVVLGEVKPSPPPKTYIRQIEGCWGWSFWPNDIGVHPFEKKYGPGDILYVCGPSGHVRPATAHLFLLVTDVRVEELRGYLSIIPNDLLPLYEWWTLNPWVWVMDFERID